jgi:lactoylglutathione lyase
MSARFAYTIAYVADVPATIAFYEKAFGLNLRFMHESNMYAELETGTTALAFAANEMIEMNGLNVRLNSPNETPPAIELAFVFDDPKVAFDQAVAAGAVAVKSVEQKPWGQLVGYVKDKNGILIEIASAVAG